VFSIRKHLSIPFFFLHKSHINCPLYHTSVAYILQVEVDGSAADGNEALECIVLAANRLSRARVASDTNDGDGAAGDANKDIEVLDDDTQES